MKSTSPLRLILGVVSVLSVGTSVLCAAATTGSTAAAESPAAVVAPAAQIPKSVFAVTKSPGEGRDPFFPNSTRNAVVVAARTNTAPNLVELALKALSGAVGNRLATISSVGPAGVLHSVVLSEGEERELATAGGRVKVRCLEIKEDSVVLEVGGVRRPLSMRKGL